jgi:hypothetical protein
MFWRYVKRYLGQAFVKPTLVVARSFNFDRDAGMGDQVKILPGSSGSF